MRLTITHEEDGSIRLKRDYKDGRVTVIIDALRPGNVSEGEFIFSTATCWPFRRRGDHAHIVSGMWSVQWQRWDPPARSGLDCWLRHLETPNRCTCPEVIEGVRLRRVLRTRLQRRIWAMLCAASADPIFRQLAVIDACCCSLWGWASYTERRVAQIRRHRHALATLATLDPLTFRDRFRTCWERERQMGQALRLLGGEDVWYPPIDLSAIDEPWALVAAVAQRVGELRGIGDPVAYLAATTESTD